MIDMNVLDFGMLNYQKKNKENKQIMDMDYIYFFKKL
jgi:hypothetical protein